MDSCLLPKSRVTMDIHSLKQLVQQETKGSDVPTPINKDNSTVFFQCNNKSWVHTTGPMRVISGEINTFENEHHQITLEITPEWRAEIHAKLEKATAAIGPMLWETCNKPTKDLYVDTYAYTKRGRKKIYVNMFNDNTNEEITGKCTLGRGAIVKLSVTWAFVKTVLDDGNVQCGWRPYLRKGIYVCKLSSQPYLIRKPWSFETVDFETMSVPMYDKFLIKTPALEVISSDGEFITVRAKDTFVTQMNLFCQNVNGTNWTATIRANVQPQAILIASIYPVRNNSEITWHIENSVMKKKRASRKASVAGVAVAEVLPEGHTDGPQQLLQNHPSYLGDIVPNVIPEQVTHPAKRRKMDRDSMGSSSDVKTKLKYTPRDNNDHN